MNQAKDLQRTQKNQHLIACAVNISISFEKLSILQPIHRLLTSKKSNVCVFVISSLREIKSNLWEYQGWKMSDCPCYVLVTSLSTQTGNINVKLIQYSHIKMVPKQKSVEEEKVAGLCSQLVPLWISQSWKAQLSIFWDLASCCTYVTKCCWFL